jgi:hypothetical protein
MKKSFCYLLIFLVGLSACHKEEVAPTPIAQSNCMGTQWRYTVTVNPAVSAGDLNVMYTVGDDIGTKAFDTGVTSSWSKDITITTPLQGTQTSYPFSIQVSRLQAIGTTSVTLHIYKGGTDAVTPVTTVLNNNVLLQTSCN